MSGKEVLKIEDISYIFSNCELILEQHQIILEQLQKIEANDWPLVRGVGKVILDGRKGLTNYGVYVGNYVNGQDNIRRLRADKNGKVNLWLQEIEAKAEHVSLALLSAPLTFPTLKTPCGKCASLSHWKRRESSMRHSA